MAGTDRGPAAAGAHDPLALPGRGGRRLLLEVADAGLGRRCAALLQADGFHVTRCSGPGRSGRRCPLLSGDACPLVDAADVVVHGLQGDRGQAVLRALRGPAGPEPPVVALPADAVPNGLVEEVRRAYAGRARRLRLSLGLRDGRKVMIRAIDARDARSLMEFDGSLSDASRRLRYLGWMAPMSRERAATLARQDFRDRFALLATTSAGRRTRVVADCRLIPMPDRDGSAEVAIAVADDFQGAGLGRALLELVLGVAADRAYAQVVAEVRFDNQRMMHLLRDLGFRISAWELGVVTFVATPTASPRRRR